MMHPLFGIRMLAQGGGSSNGGGFWIGLILMMGVFYFIMLSGTRKDKKRQEMLANLKKSDRVMTKGGILGSVVSVNEQEVTLKVDESANVKITVVRSAIQTVLSEGEKPAEVP